MDNDELMLSRELVIGIIDHLKEHDPRCENELIACQYLSAITGFIVSMQTMNEHKKSEILDDLLAFSRHVLQSVQAPSQQDLDKPDASAAASSFGIWKPGDP